MWLKLKMSKSVSIADAVELTQDRVPISVNHQITSFFTKDFTEFLHVSDWEIGNEVANLIDARHIFSNIGFIYWRFIEHAELVNVWFK